MENEINFEQLHALIQQKQYRAARNALVELNVIDIGAFLEELTEQDGAEAVVIFRLLPKELLADIFPYISAETQQHIIEGITEKELSFIIEELYIDDAVDMLEELPANIVKRVLRNASKETRTQINQFLRYPEDSAGSIMTAEFVDLKKRMTVKEAIEHIRQEGAASETIYTCYVINNRRVLEGVVTVKDLLLSNDATLVEDIMETQIIKAATTDDQEEISHLFSKYNLIAMPVVDGEDRLVGIITVDDVVDVMEEEVTEDFEKMAAMHPSEKPYLKTGVFRLALNRIPWLLVLMVSAMVTGSILGSYEAALAAIPLLVTFIPMLTDTGGNAGSQSSTLVIRGMAVNEIRATDFLKVIWKETRVALIAATALNLVNSVRIYLMYHNEPNCVAIILTLTITLYGTVIMANVLGGALPIIAKSIKLDPAIMASPLITTIVDALSLIVYMKAATYFLQLAESGAIQSAGALITSLL